MSAPATRRGFLLSGAITVAFAFGRSAGAQDEGSRQGAGPPKIAPELPGDLVKFPDLDSWIRLGPDGGVTVFSGKAELGQGLKTALLQIAADELDVSIDRVALVTADTGRSPDEGVTAGSHSMQDSGTAILNAAANVRVLLIKAAAARWNIPTEQISIKGGVIRAADGRAPVSYGDIASELNLHVAAIPDAPRKPGADRRFIGQNWPRVDIPSKLTGGEAYVQDMRLPGMLHARVVRGPSYGTEVTASDFDAIARQPGIVKLVREGRFVAILSEREWDATRALQALQASGWSRSRPDLPNGDLHQFLRERPSKPMSVFNYPSFVSGGIGAVSTYKARYTRPFLLHGSIGPSCAVALWQNGVMSVWTHSQGVGPLRNALAELLSLPPEKVRCIHLEGSGCYGHNGADDVAADAALAARAMPGRPVRMQWMREQEHGWEPLGPAMTVDLEAGLDSSGRIVRWRYDVWSNEHNSRPTSAGGLLAGLEVDPSFAPQTPKPIPMPEGGADRNGNPLYALSDAAGTYHFPEEAPFRVSALRSLGAHMNVFAIESFMDELAAKVGRDPIAFRLAHLQDERAKAVIQRATERFGWPFAARSGELRGAGFAFARYKNLGAYCAAAMEIAIDRDSGRISVPRVVAAVDSGEAVNPDGICNQIEGAIVQSLSWTTVEQATFDSKHRLSFDWSAYPILRFDNVPERIEVHVIDRPGQPFLGTGEAGQGPAAAALANAVASAAGVRIRDMPISAERVKAARGV